MPLILLQRNNNLYLQGIDGDMEELNPKTQTTFKLQRNEKETATRISNTFRNC